MAVGNALQACISALSSLTLSVGLQAEERAVSQDLEIWISTSELDNGYGLVLRAGRLVQEITITSSLSKEELREMTQKVLKEVK